MRKFTIPDELELYDFTEVFTRKIGGIEFQFGVIRERRGLEIACKERTTNPEYPQNIWLCHTNIPLCRPDYMMYQHRYIAPWILEKLLPYMLELRRAADIWEIRHNN